MLKIVGENWRIKSIGRKKEIIMISEEVIMF